MRAIVMLMCLSLAGCASVEMFTEKYPPRNSDEKIEVYHTKYPSREYVEIGEIDSPWGMDSIKDKAKTIGADAIIITGRSGYKKKGRKIKEYGLRAVAIRYKD